MDDFMHKSKSHPHQIKEMCTVSQLEPNTHNKIVSNLKVKDAGTN